MKEKNGEHVNQSLVHATFTFVKLYEFGVKKKERERCEGERRKINGCCKKIFITKVLSKIKSQQFFLSLKFI